MELEGRKTFRVLSPSDISWRNFSPDQPGTLHHHSAQVICKSSVSTALQDGGDGCHFGFVKPFLLFVQWGVIFWCFFHCLRFNFDFVTLVVLFVLLAVPEANVPTYH